MKPIIKEISEFIKDDLKHYEKSLVKSLNSDVNLINSITKYIIQRKGKRFRPLLCILCSRLEGEPNELTYMSASAVEILHVATLLHDDVVDDAQLRRSWPTVNSIWKNKLSILVGDYMFSRALKNFAMLKNINSIEILSKLSERLSQGEISQIENAMKKNMSEETYFKMIADKTASLLSASCMLGYLSVQDNNHKKENLKNFGNYLGISYQLKDDLFDVLGKIEKTGKSAKMDLKKNILTLPYIHMLNKVNKRTKKNIIRKLKYHFKRKDLKEIEHLINEYGGIQYTKNKIADFTEMAISELNVFSESEYKTLLIKSANFNVERDF